MTRVVIGIVMKLVIDSLLELFPFWTIVIEQLWVFYQGRALLSCWPSECFHAHFLKNPEVGFSNIVLFMSLIKAVM